MAQNPHVRQTLVPERLDGGPGELTFQITAESVSPTAICGYDDGGNPIEDSVPNAYWEWWVNLSGSIRRVPMRSSSIFSNDYQHKLYEHEKYIDHIRAGQMPAWVCPYTTEFKHIKGGPLIKVPAGEEDCGGSGEAHRNIQPGPNPYAPPKVCKHMQKVIDQRVAAARKKHEEIQKDSSSLSMANAEKLMETAAKAFAQENQRAARPKPVKAEE